MCGCGSEFAVSQTQDLISAAVHSMGNVSDILGAKFVLQLCEFYPGFIKVCNTALAVFWRVKLSLAGFFLMNTWTMSLRQESFCPY